MTKSPGSPTRAKSIAPTGCRYAWDWVRKTDPNGYLQMPGSRTLRIAAATTCGGTTPTIPARPSPMGFGDEEAIRAIWAADGGSRK